MGLADREIKRAGHQTTKFRGREDGAARAERRVGFDSPSCIDERLQGLAGKPDAKISPTNFFTT